jgi:mRNA-degrading endonuclease RelE of RelBE toxin-antitoxin system
MSYEILRTNTFSKHLKLLAKKYRTIVEDYSALLQSLRANPLQGDALGRNCYKVRMSITAKGKGKSGGARVITYIKIEKKSITLLDIYDKSDKESISEKELTELLKLAAE